MMDTRKTPRFRLGRLVATPGALEAMTEAGDTPLTFLARHQVGDWGDVDEGDRKANDFEVDHGGRLLSSYRLSDNTRIWIITEADRSATTILLPEEY